MNGQSGGRGYLIQALISVLEALTDDAAWITLEMEPNQSSEKIDVVWHYQSGNKIVQIKSSQNQISIANVRAWATDLKASTVATEYELKLIGPISESVAKMESHDGVLIPIPQQLNLVALLHQAAHKLDGYLRSRSLMSFSPTARELLVHALVAKLAEYATKGTPVSRNLFDETLCSWIKEMIPSPAVGATNTNVSTDLAKLKLSTAMSITDQISGLDQSLDYIQAWSAHIKNDDELAELSSHFPASGAIVRVRNMLYGLNSQRSWMMGWKVNALIFAIHFKGREMLVALERYGSETEDWQLKRGHQLAASSLSSVVRTYINMCLREIVNDIAQHPQPVDDSPSDSDFASYSRQLGDMSREESKNFAQDNSALSERLRDSNMRFHQESASNFKYRLMCERHLNSCENIAYNLPLKQRIDFLKRLYKECLGFYFRMWNDPLIEDQGEIEFRRLDFLLQRQSTNEICSAFSDMIAIIKSTVEQTTPIARKDYPSQDEFYQAYLKIINPSAVAYKLVKQLVESHLLELTSSGATAM